MPQRPNNFTINRNHPLANGLVFAGLGAHAGSTRYHDSSAYGNTGTLTAMDPPTDVVYAMGRTGLDYVTDDRVVIPHRPSLIMPDKFSFCLWLDSDITNYTANAYPFGPWENATNKRQWALTIPSATDKISIITCADGTVVTSSNADTTQSVQIGLHHIAFTATNSTKQWLFYYDGRYIETISAYATFAQLGSLITVGGLDGSGNSIDGRIYDPLLYARTLSAPEIQNLADPSNVMLSGLINYPRRKWWPVVAGGTPATFKAAWAARRRQVIGGGIT